MTVRPVVDPLLPSGDAAYTIEVQMCGGSAVTGGETMSSETKSGKAGAGGLRGLENPDRLHFSFVDPCQMLVYPPGGRIGPRQTIDWEFVWIVDGTARWTVDGVQHDLKPGSVVLRPPGVQESYFWGDEHQTRIIYFHFRVANGDRPLDWHPDWPLVHHLPERDVLRPLFRHISFLQKHGSSQNDVLVQMATRLLFAAFVSGRCEVSTEAPKRLPVPVEKALRFAEKSWTHAEAQGMSLTGMAKAGGVSVRHLGRLFKEFTGHSPAKAVALLRLQAAAELLMKSDAQVQEIAHQLGFENAFHFSRRFAALYGDSPRAFRDAYLRSGQAPQSLVKLHVTFDGGASAGQDVPEPSGV